MSAKVVKTLMCDFETTVYEGQDFTEVWASAVVELYTEDVKIFHSIDETFEYFQSLNTNLICYYHNLKFDGAFWLSYLLDVLHYEQAYNMVHDTITWANDRFMKNNSFKYTISDMGQWYTIKIKTHRHTIEIRDSLKLLPFSVKRIGQSFGTKHKKLDMEYKGFRYAGCTITDKEKEYIANDVLVVKEALEILYNEGHNKLTIGSCCMNEYKKITGKYDYKVLYPDLTEIELPETYHYKNADEYIRKSYKGGWCYLVKEKSNKIIHNGITADVNSLYPSMMSSESGNIYPYGKPVFWSGNFIPEEALKPNRYFFIRLRTRFYLKENYLPFIQIKNSYSYKGTEALETSDVYNKVTRQYMPYWKDRETGETKQAIPTLILTMTDYYLMLEHYTLKDTEILDGCYFCADKGLFDTYIDKYKRIKLESKGARRELAKLFLNNLYGKMATNDNSSFKLAYLNEDDIVGFRSIPEHNKAVAYIPVGSAITSYARNFTIRAAQKNYHGKGKPGFIYADTDSIHCDLSATELIDIPVHDKDFCHWKLESSWDTALFVRQKTYIEHITHENLNPIETPYYNIKCAGMPEKCKQLFLKSVEGYTPKPEDNYTQEELDFLSIKRELTDFKIGLLVPGKLMPKRIKGGVVLTDTTYEMREK